MSELSSTVGRPTRRQHQVQAALDSAAALVLAMLAWPFPLARALLPVPVNVVCVIVFWQLVQVLYCAITAGVWGQTGGMRLQGLGLFAEDGESPGRTARAKWGALAGAVALKQALFPSSVETPSFAERIAGVHLRTL